MKKQKVTVFYNNREIYSLVDMMPENELLAIAHTLQQLAKIGLREQETYIPDVKKMRFTISAQPTKMSSAPLTHNWKGN